MTRSVSNIEQVASNLYKKYGTKADAAREMLDMGYSVSQISKAVPMAYSQVHSYLAKGRVNGDANRRSEQRTDQRTSAGRSAKAGRSRVDSGRGGTAPQGRVEPASSRIQGRPQTCQQMRAPSAPQSAPPRIGKLQTPGFTSDRQIGECFNCGHDLVVRKWPGAGAMLVHINITSDEYLDTVQFCHAVPTRLLR